MHMEVARDLVLPNERPEEVDGGTSSYKGDRRELRTQGHHSSCCVCGPDPGAATDVTGP